MAPEEVYSLLVLRLRWERGQLLADGERVEKLHGPIYVSWYTTSTSEAQVSIADGLVRVWDAPDLQRETILDAVPADLGESYKWRDPAPAGGPLMLAMSLPTEYTITDAIPTPVEAKEHAGCVAVFWILPPDHQVSLMWGLGKLVGDIRTEVQRINREGLDDILPDRSGGFDYDVALSFAGEDRPYVEKVAKHLVKANVKVFYDGFEEAALWGTNLYDHLSEVYSKRARYTVMFISSHYAEKVWTNHERQMAQERALTENSAYILPARFDDTPVPGLSKTTGYLSLEGREPEDLAQLVVQKLQQI